MAQLFYDRIKEVTTTTGTGTLSLAGAVVDFLPFSTIGDGHTCYYVIDDGSANWEVGIGTYASSGNTLARTSVLSSSNSGSAVSFAAGSKTVWLDVPATVFSAVPTSVVNDTNVTGTLSGNVLTLGWTGTLAAGRVSTLNQNTTGSAATLTTPRAINGVNFDGSAPITVTAAAGTLTGTTLAANVVTSSLTTIGTLVGGSIPYSLVTGGPSAVSGANPTASVGLSAVNGSAATFLRSDGAPALDVTIAPSWSGAHTFTNKAAITLTQAVIASAAPVAAFTLTAGAHTALTASTEYTISNLDGATNQPQWATGTLTSNRWIRIQAPKPYFVGASTITAWSTFDISGGAVTGGVNVTAITNNYAFTVGGAASPVASIDGTGNGVFNQLSVVANNGIIFTGRGRLNGDASVDGVLTLYNSAASGFSRLNLGGNTSSFPAMGRSTTFLTQALADGTAGGGIKMTGLLAQYNNVTTTGWGVPAIYGRGRSTAQTAAVASVATYTVGAADGTFEVSANINITTSTTFSIAAQVTYTDETNTAQTLVLPTTTLAGAFLTAVTNVQGAGPYETPVMHIRCKAATAITILTAGTFTSVTYNVEGTIKQVA